MTLLFAMLPLYLLGNVHCFGMCGPLVMMIGHHRYKYFYFLGRALSFTIAGLVAGALGEVLNAILKQYYIQETTSFIFGTLLIYLGWNTFSGGAYLGQQWLARKLATVSQNLSLLMLKDRALPAFLFGFFTLALPCGQTLIVFSACALSADMGVGLVNGMAFALLTSPSLFLAMKAHAFFKYAKNYYTSVMGLSAILVGLLAILRAFAEMGYIEHFVINPKAAVHYHLVIF